MTRFHNVSPIIPTLFSILLFSCSTKHFSAGLYQSHINSHRSDSFKSETITSTFLNGHTIGTNGCIDGTSLKDVSLMVRYQQDSTGNAGGNDCRAVIVSIDSIQHGRMRGPIFKHSTFQSNVPVRIQRILFRPAGDSIQVVRYLINGQVNVTGKIKINGLCSYREAHRLMVRSVLDNVYTAVRKEMDDKN